jgi:general secretion pathway protein D
MREPTPYTRSTSFCGALALATGVALCGCTTLPSSNSFTNANHSSNDFIPLQLAPSAASLYSSIRQTKLTNASRQLAAKGVQALDKHNFKQANDLFNLALKTDLNNSYLHFLNALAYHYRGIEGESNLLTLAEQGYDMAVQFDASNTTARHYRGLLHLDRREYAQAQKHLMEASLYTQDDAELLYDMGVAAYYNKDPATAYAAFQGLQSLAANTELRPQTLRGLAILAASVGDNKQAAAYLDDMRKSGASPAESDFVSRRIGSWNATHASGFVKAQFPKPGAPLTPAPSGFPPPGGFTPPAGAPSGYPPPGGFAPPGGTPPGYAPPGGYAQPGGVPSGYAAPGAARLPGQSGLGAFVDKQMVMVDVVIVSTQEDNNNTMGVNLLDGLKFQFGNASGTPAWSRSQTSTTDLLTATASTATRTITRSLGLSAIAYTLNIANASEISNDILARPTLLALAGQTSQFFSGTDIVGAAVSAGQGSSVQIQKEVGVRLAVTPEFLPDNLIRMQVVAERTFLTNPSSNVVFDFRLDTTKTMVHANVVMKFGETLILSGLSERDSGVNNSGVPVLRDVPLAQYLFSRKSERDFQKSVLIMITPRRPQYTNRDEADIKEERAAFSERDRVQAEFEDKHRLWYQMIPSTAYAISQLSESPVFREFRSGDLELPSWVSRRSHSGRIRAALNFLFY